MARTAKTTKITRTAKPARKASKPTTSKQALPPVETPVDVRRGSVVHVEFKQRYAERGNPDHNGDWLASTLAEVLPKPINPDSLYSLLAANGLDADKLRAKWGSHNIGQQRMWGGQVLRPLVATEGKLVVPGEKVARTAPREFVAKFGH